MDQQVKACTSVSKKNLIVPYLLYLCEVVASILPIIGAIFINIKKDSDSIFQLEIVFLACIGFFIATLVMLFVVRRVNIEYVAGRKNLIIIYLLCLYGMIGLEAAPIFFMLYLDSNQIIGLDGSPILFWMMGNSIFVMAVLFSGVIALIIGTICAYIHKSISDEVLASHYVFLLRTLISMAIYIMVLIVLYNLPNFIVGNEKLFGICIFVWSVVLSLGTIFWCVPRGVIGLKFLLNNQAHPNPRTFLYK